MPVVRLELENFKSYAGQQTIGPFVDFTSIIGPNGSGKSNLMDAISFVLGVQSRDLRSTQLLDLIHRSHRNLSAKAVLVYQHGDEEIHFGRSISNKGVGDYWVNDEKVSWKEYEKALSEIGVLVKARNFLVFQGDVESLARKSPQELVALVETVSGSVQFAEEYEEALSSKQTAEANQVHLFKRLKSFKSERKLYKDQTREAERFQDLLQEKASLQTDLYLWQLYHLDQDRQERQEALKELQQEQADQNTQEAHKALKKSKKTLSVARRQTNQAQDLRLKAAQALDKLEPAIIQATEESKSLEKKISKDHTALSKKQTQAEQHEEKIEQIEKDIAEYKSHQAELEMQFQKAQDGAAKLTKEQQERYEVLRLQAAAASAAPRQELVKMQRLLDPARTKADETNQELKQAQETLQQVSRDVEEWTQRRDDIQKALAKTKTELEKTEAELVDAQKQAQESLARRQQLDVELEQVETKIRRLEGTRRRNRDEERLVQAVATLQRHFTGVHGRLVDVCRPTTRKYNLAVTVAAGKDMDAIVVDTKQTAVECITYLREQRIGHATFLPLDHLQTPPPESTNRLRAQIGQNYSLAVDVITCDDLVKAAVQYAVGNTVVANDLESARSLCFGRRQLGIKAVTLGGAVISKSGTMTGGVTNESGSNQNRWDAQEMKQLEERKAKLQAERAEVFTTNSAMELKTKLANVKNKQHFSQSDAEYTKGQLEEKSVLKKSTKKQVAKLKKQVEAAEADFEKANTAVQKAISAVKDAEDEHFADFCTETGLDDLDEYEQAIGKSRDDFNAQKRTIMEHVAQLEEQKTYEEGRDMKQPIVRIEKRIKERQTALGKSQKRETELTEQVQEAKQKLEESQANVTEATEHEKSLEEEVQKAQTAFDEVQAEHVRITKAINAGETALERLRSKLHETLQKARVEEVVLPMLGESGGRTRSQRHSGAGGDDDSQDSEDEVAQSQTTESGTTFPFTQDSNTKTHFSQAQDAIVVRDQQMSDQVDFGRMPGNLKNRLTDRDEKKMRKDFEEKIAKVAAEIEQITPNMKASEAFKAATDRLKDNNSDYEKAKEEASKAARAFQRIKAKRSKTFNDAFNHIDEALKTIYTDMTKSSKHPLGGNAYLSLEDAEEPYKGGLKFNAMPPMKRFRDMEQLSGGEKTVAALSLLFAIHSFHPAPFFVMDEVDAALDNVNLNKVCNYIKQRSQTDFQCIVISLKDMFYEHSQGLVGTYRDVGSNSSSTLTLDLTKYDSKSRRESKRSLIDEEDVEESPRSRRNKVDAEDSVVGSPDTRRSLASKSTPGSVSRRGTRNEEAPTPGSPSNLGRKSRAPAESDEEEGVSESSPSPKRTQTRSRSTSRGRSKRTRT